MQGMLKNTNIQSRTQKQRDKFRSQQFWQEKQQKSNESFLKTNNQAKGQLQKLPGKLLHVSTMQKNNNTTINGEQSSRIYQNNQGQFSMPQTSLKKKQMFYSPTKKDYQKQFLKTEGELNNNNIIIPPKFLQSVIQKIENSKIYTTNEQKDQKLKNLLHFYKLQQRQKKSTPNLSSNQHSLASTGKLRKNSFFQKNNLLSSNNSNNNIFSNNNIGSSSNFSQQNSSVNGQTYGGQGWSTMTPRGKSLMKMDVGAKCLTENNNINNNYNNNNNHQSSYNNYSTVFQTQKGRYGNQRQGFPNYKQSIKENYSQYYSLTTYRGKNNLFG